MLKVPAPGSSPGRSSTRSQGWEDGFLLTNREKTEADTSQHFLAGSKQVQAFPDQRGRAVDPTPESTSESSLGIPEALASQRAGRACPRSRPEPRPQGLRANRRGDRAPAWDSSPTSGNAAVPRPPSRRYSVPRDRETTEPPSSPKPLKQPEPAPFLRGLRCPERLLRRQSLVSSWPWNLRSLSPNSLRPSSKQVRTFLRARNPYFSLMDPSISSPESSPLPAPCLQTHPPPYHRRQLRRQKSPTSDPRVAGASNYRDYISQEAPRGPRPPANRTAALFAASSRGPIRMREVRETFPRRLQWEAECRDRVFSWLETVGTERGGVSSGLL